MKLGLASTSFFSPRLTQESQIIAESPDVFIREKKSRFRDSLPRMNFFTTKLEVNHEPTAGKYIVPAQSAFWVAGKSDAGRAKAGLAAQKIAQLNAQTYMRQRSFYVSTCPELECELVGVIVRKGEMGQASAQTDPGGDGRRGKELCFERRRNVKRREMGDKDIGRLRERRLLMSDAGNRYFNVN